MADKETVRLEAFSDGVFAIAITLLIIEIHVPEVEGGGWVLARALLDLWPKFFAFTLSFVTILIMWMNHHAMFAWVEKPTGPVFVGNGLLLLTITALPFTTAVLGDYLQHDGEKTAAGVYAAHMILINLGFVVLWNAIAAKRAIIAPRLAKEEVDRTNLYCFASLGLYAAALAAAFWDARVSVGITFLLAAFWTWNAYRRFRVVPT